MFNLEDKSRNLKGYVFNLGDKVRKPKGYAFDGIVVGIIYNTKGELRIVAELEDNGMLHIFSPQQLELR